MLFKKQRISIAEKNYAVNQSNPEPDDMINGQGALTGYRFGLCTLDRVGCGIIAVYNALRLLKTPVKFIDLIREFETNSTETIPFGFFGINPFSMKKYFETHFIAYSIFHRIAWLEKMKDNGGVYVLTYWNDAKKLTKGAHTVAVLYINGKFAVFNLTNNKKDVALYDTAAEIIDDGLLIRGYQLYGAFYEGESDDDYSDA